MRERNSIFVLSEFRPAMKKQQQQEQKKKKKHGIFNAKIQLLFYKAVLKFFRTPFSRICKMECISQLVSFNSIPQQKTRPRKSIKGVTN